MNTKIMNSLVLAICGILFWIIVADINGKWTGFVDYNGSLIPMSFNLKTDGEKLTGTTETPLGANAIEDGKVERDQINFKVDLNGSKAVFTGHTFADSINLKISYQGEEYQTTLKRTSGQ